MCLKEIGVRMLTGFIELRLGSRDCAHNNKSSDSLKGGEFLDYLDNCQLLKKEFCSMNPLIAASI
jgi:hypothetical protein